MYPRLLKIANNSQESYFLFGPRGVGKTTWVKNNFPSDTYIDLLEQNIFFDLSANPQHLKRYFPVEASKWIIIDEIQKIPALLNEVHRLIEHEKRKFILTGSSARSLRKKGVNLLAGRALQLTMHPLTAIEQGEQFNLGKTLLYGQLPKVKTSNDPKLYLQAYINMYLREEVLQEGLTRNMQLFYRFLEIASFAHGEQINLSAIAREVGVNQKLIASYFDILEDLLIAKRIKIFTKRAKRRLSHHPKFYLFDVGVYKILRPKGPLDSISEINGHALEGLFFQEISAINAYLKAEYEFYFWRTSNQIEVDFIAYGPKSLLAFEIKSSTYVDKKNLTGLKAFKTDYPMAKCYLIYLGEHCQYIDNIEIIPFNKALMSLDKLLISN
ncbi:MAG: ATPase [Gammaproteobacteria bacterium RIFCSPHIGHO2_12_FULL_35_23]|nr:MAG: ATPase [Gammaproteobacteria bacterium RIFCSPHIGHO2_12_FULL_35_23]